MKNILLLVLSSLLLSSCVSSKVYKELNGRYEQSQLANDGLRQENEALKADLKLNENKRSSLEEALADARLRHDALQTEHQALQKRYEDLNQSYEYLLQNNNEMLASNQRENKKLVQQLNETQRELADKEDRLRSEGERLAQLSAALQAREAKIAELESLMAQQDSATESVLASLKKALLSFEGKGLSVENRGGKVYVSLENRLLFPSASWTVEPAGKEALQELAKVLAQNPELKVMVEGHTDSDAYNGRTAVKDNWDLSVMRATSIVKILTENQGIDKANITAAGRSEYLPIADNDSAEGKAKNRRTEIIITPDLSELSRLLEERKGLN